MSQPTHVRLTPRALLFTVFLAAAVTAGCHKWTAFDPAPPSAEQLAEEEEIRVHLRDGSELVLQEEIRLERDTLFGFSQHTSAYDQTPQGRIAVPMRDVREIDARRGDPWATTGVILGVAVGVPLAGWKISCIGDEDSFLC